MKHPSCTFTSIFALSLVIVIEGCAPPQSGSGAGGFVSRIIMLMILFLIVFAIPLVKAWNASKSADKFKTLVFVTTFLEWLGWIICITIIGIPIGLGLVLVSQQTRVLLEIERNTSSLRNKANS